jgi:hypothetical protein
MQLEEVLAFWGGYDFPLDIIFYLRMITPFSDGKATTYLANSTIPD